MAKKNKKQKKQSKGEGKPVTETAKDEDRVTMEAIEEMSTSDGELPPEEEWGADAKALKKAINGGAFDVLLKNSKGKQGQKDDDEQSVEEYGLYSDEEGEGANDDEEMSNGEAPVEEDELSEESAEEEEQEGQDIAEQKDVEDEEGEEEESDEEVGEEEEQESDEEAEEEESDGEGDPEDEEDESKKLDISIDTKNQSHSKALHVVTDELKARKRNWPWAETFDCVAPTPLPFGAKGSETYVDIHDDLKREVAFYDLALEGVMQAKALCEKATLPFARPDDYFAEMVKTDEHMARIKDRLIFESKKIDAVAQRKANKEQKLRSKESRTNKIAEKNKRKKDHFKAVEEWAQSAASNRGRPLDEEDGRRLSAIGGGRDGPNKKRMAADKKHGFGGKKGRFKQNDPKSRNDVSGFNPRGNFGGLGTKRSAKSSPAGAAKRPGKRARDARKSRG